MSLSVSALDHLTALSQLQHVQEFDEAQTHNQLEVTEPAISSQSTSPLKKCFSSADQWWSASSTRQTGEEDSGRVLCGNG